MALRAWNASPLLAIRTPRARATDLGQGPALAPWFSGGLPAYPSAEGSTKDPRPEEKNADVQKNTLIHIYTAKKVTVLIRRVQST